jgi:15-cis-phytoene synthase
MRETDYCAEKILRPGHSLYYVVRFAPKPIRATLIAVFAFYRETTEIIDECNDISIARTKLQWWRDEIGRLYQGQAHHPITKALAKQIDLTQIPAEYWQEVIDGTEMWLDGAFLDTKDLTLYAHRVGAMTALTIAEILGYKNRLTLKFAHELGTAIHLTQLLREVRRHFSAGRVIIPQQDLQMAQLSPEHFLQPQSSDAVRKLFRYQAARIEKHYQDAWSQLPTEDQTTQYPLITLGKLQQLHLAKMAALDYALLENNVTIVPIKKLWIAWRERR